MPSRKIEDLHPAVEPLCRRFLALCEERGIRAMVTSTLRTEAEQLALFAQGRKGLKTVNELRAEAGLPPITDKKNRIVTYASTSIHQFGCAFDVALLTPPAHLESRGETGGKWGVTWDVKADINANDVPDYEEMGRIGESVGLTWGGRFRFRDYCHFQYTGGLALEDLRAGRRPSRWSSRSSTSTSTSGRATRSR